MISVLNSAVDSLRGAVSVEPGAAGFVMHRTSSRIRQQFADPYYDYPSSCPSGVRLSFRTDADRLEIDLAVARAASDVPLPPVQLDIVDDGRLLDPLPITSESRIHVGADGSIRIEHAPPETVRVELDGTGDRVVEAWLPSNAVVELVDVRVPDGAVFSPAGARGPVWIHHGSSISHCMEVERPTQAWPSLVARRGGLDLLNLGLAGQCQLDQGVARTIRDTAADLISLEIGINIAGGASMIERTFVSAFHGFLDTIRDGAPETPIVVMTPIHCGPLEDAPGPLHWDDSGRVFTAARPPEISLGVMSLARTRALLEEHVIARRGAGDSNLFLVDGLDLFGAADAADLPDGLHPNIEGYARIAARFSSHVIEGDRRRADQTTGRL